MLLLLCTNYSLRSQNCIEPIGEKSAALGYCSIASKDVYSIFNNPAGLTGISNPVAVASYRNRFFIDKLSLRSLGVALPSGLGTFGFSIQRFGYNLYHETQYGLAYGKKFSDSFSAGLRLNYFSFYIADGYGKKGNVIVDGGINAILTEGFFLAVHVFNPLSFKKNDDDDQIPSNFSLGFYYRLSEELGLYAETEKELNYKPSLRLGMEYKGMQKASARIGYSTLPSTTGALRFSISSVFTFGFGIELSRFNIDFAASVNHILGWSPGISMVYKFNPDDK